MKDTKIQIAKVFHGQCHQKESINITINDELSTAFIIERSTPETVKAFHYKLKELQELGYKIKFE